MTAQYNKLNNRLILRTAVCTNSTAPSVSSINRILRNRAAERAAAEFARVGAYAGLYYGGGPGGHPTSSQNPSSISGLQGWASATGYPPSLLSQLAAGSGLFLPNGMPGGLTGLQSGLTGMSSSGMNGSSLTQSREDTPHSISPRPSPDMVKQFSFFKRSLFHLFSSFQKIISIFRTNKCVKMSIQYTVQRLEPMTFGT